MAELTLSVAGNSLVHNNLLPNIIQKFVSTSAIDLIKFIDEFEIKPPSNSDIDTCFKCAIHVLKSFVNFIVI
jgi:hypothetical protein